MTLRGNEKRWWRLICVLCVLRWVKMKKPESFEKLRVMTSVFKYIPVKWMLYDAVYYELVKYFTKEMMGEEMMKVVLSPELLMEHKVDELSKWTNEFKKRKAN